MGLVIIKDKPNHFRDSVSPVDIVVKVCPKVVKQKDNFIFESDL